MPTWTREEVVESVKQLERECAAGGLALAPCSAVWPCPHRCDLWCRTDGSMTNHHPRCEHVDASLMDVWRLTIDGASCLFDDEPLTAEMDLEPGSFTVTKERMHAEIFRALPEFSGW